MVEVPEVVTHDEIRMRVATLGVSQWTALMMSICAVLGSGVLVLKEMRLAPMPFET